MEPDESALDVMPRLLSALPELDQEWTAYRESAAYGPNEPYNDLGWLASQLAARLRSTNTHGFDRVFDEVEALLMRDSGKVRELIVSGFLEDIQNISLNNSMPLDAWHLWLGTRTREAWQAVQDLWAGDLSPEEFNRFVETGKRLQ